jgi:hypothetical protein
MPDLQGPEGYMAPMRHGHPQRCESTPVESSPEPQNHSIFREFEGPDESPHLRPLRGTGPGAVKPAIANVFAGSVRVKILSRSVIFGFLRPSLLGPERGILER